MSDTGGTDATPATAKLARLGAACAVIGMIWLFALGRWITTDTVAPWDSKNQFYAFFRFLAAALHAGATPFWNPYHYGGHPSVADPQSLVFSPAFVLWGLFDNAPSLRSFDVIVFAHLLPGALAVGVIGWRARWPIVACVLAASVFMLGGPAAGRLQHTGIILSYAVFPITLLLLTLALERRSLGAALGFAFFAAQLVLGRNQVALLLSVWLAAYVLCAIVKAERPVRFLRERALVLTVMLSGTVALIAVPMLLTLQFAALSNRPAVPLADALAGSLHPVNLATLAVADVFGTHEPQYWGPNAATLPEVRFTDDSFNYLFVGATTAMLALWLGFAGMSAFRRGRLLLSGVLALALLYMLGRYTPFFAPAFQWLPGVALFRRPVDASFVLLMALAMLSGHLLADYVRDGLPRLRLLPSILVAAGAIAVLVTAVVFSARSGHQSAALLAVGKALLVAAVVAVLLVIARTPRQRSLAAGVLTAVAVAELIAWNAAFRLNAEPRANYAVLEAPAGVEAQAIAALEDATAERRAAGERPRVEVLGLGGPWQNLAMVRGWEAINGYNPLRIGTYDRLVAPGEENWRADMRVFPASFAGYDSALARALGLEFLVLDRPVENIPHLLHRPDAAVLFAGPPIWIYRLSNPLPRVVFHAETGPGDTSDQTEESAKARLVGWRPDRIEIETNADRPGVLDLHMTAYPGWIAEVDGRAVPLMRAAPPFMAIKVPAGHHHLVLRYAPFSLANLKDALRRVVGW
ncbi:MAG: YfhO family protein [Xanthobacteraceae bacterium]